MKRWVFILCAILGMHLLPGGGTPLEQLEPVELLLVLPADPGVILLTDTGDMGEGETLALALEDLEEHAEGKIFLETAEQLVVTEKTLWALPELTELLRPAAEVTLGAGRIVPDTAARYLRYHSPHLTLGALRRAEREIPILRGEEGGYCLEYRGK